MQPGPTPASMKSSFAYDLRHCKNALLPLSQQGSLLVHFFDRDFFGLKRKCQGKTPFKVVGQQPLSQGSWFSSHFFVPPKGSKNSIPPAGGGGGFRPEPRPPHPLPGKWHHIISARPAVAGSWQAKAPTVRDRRSPAEHWRDPWKCQAHDAALAQRNTSSLSRPEMPARRRAVLDRGAIRAEAAFLACPHERRHEREANGSQRRECRNDCGQDGGRRRAGAAVPKEIRR